MQDKVPLVSKCGNHECGNTFTTQTHLEYPHNDIQENKIIHIHYDGPSYSVHCANCGGHFGDVFSPNQ